MKKLSLDSNIYKKFFELSQKLSANLKEDVDLLTINFNVDKLSKYILENSKWNILEWEKFGRIMHYIILDNIDLIKQYLDSSKEVEILKTSMLWIFEIIEITENFIKLLDISSWQTYEIIWEWEWSEKSLLDCEEWDLLISRLIKLDDWWYNMKNFYYINKSVYWSWDWFEELKIGYKHLFSWVKDMLDMEERMNNLNKAIMQEWLLTNINYLKKIKNLLLKPVWKKKYNELEKILQKKDSNTYSDFLNFLSKFKISNNLLNELKWYVSIYLKENIKTPKKEKEEKLYLRLQVVMNSFFQYLIDIKKELTNDRKITKEEQDDLEKIKEEWLNNKSSLFSNKTPIEFIHEVDPEYDISNLQLKQIDPVEQEFYDWYMKYFNDEDKEYYDRWLEKAKKQDPSAYRDFEKLMYIHGEFFRLRANYIMTKYHYLIDKYIRKSLWDNNDLSEVSEDKVFVSKIDDEIKYIKKLKPTYIFPSWFEKLVKDINFNLIMWIKNYLNKY